MMHLLEQIVIAIWNRLHGRRKRPKDLSETLTLGFRVVEGQVTNRPVQLSLTLRARHTALFGKSGVGKTSYIKHDCALAIRANRGAFILDLHGDLTPFILGTIAAEEERRQQDLSDRVIVISPSDRDMSVGLNPLEGVSGDFGRTTEIAEVLRQHAHLEYLGPRTEELLRNSIVVLSTNTYSFVSVGSLSSPARARELAARLREQHDFILQGMPLCLGRLESSDFAPLSAQRKEAVHAFWSAYFAAGGEPAEIHFDGTGILADVDRGCFSANP